MRVPAKRWGGGRPHRGPSQAALLFTRQRRYGSV